jgi:hypothetical protein
MAPMEYLGAWGTLIHEKNLKSKISCQTPFKIFLLFSVGAGRGLEGLIESIQEKLKDALWRLSLLQFVQMTMHQLR